MSLKPSKQRHRAQRLRYPDEWAEHVNGEPGADEHRRSPALGT